MKLLTEACPYTEFVVVLRTPEDSCEVVLERSRWWLACTRELKDAQPSRVPGDCVVLVITQYNFPEPRTDFGHAIMHPALKLNLDGFELRNHSLFRSDPPYGEGSALVALPTAVGEAQEGEGLCFSLSTQIPVAGGDHTPVDRHRFIRPKPR